MIFANTVEDLLYMLYLSDRWAFEFRWKKFSHWNPPGSNEDDDDDDGPYTICTSQLLNHSQPEQQTIN